MDELTAVAKRQSIDRARRRPFVSLLLLGRQCIATATMAATAQFGEGPLFLMDYLLRFLRVAVLLALWRIILADKGTVSGMTLDDVLTYTLLAEVFAEPLAARTELAWILFQGDLGGRFLRPMALVAQFAAEAVGRWLVGLVLFSLPLLLLAPLLGVSPAPPSLAALGAFAVSLVLAVAVGLSIDHCFGALAVAFHHNVYVVDRVRGGIGAVLSGALLPLALLPGNLGNIFGYLPFAAMASAPLRIYTATGPTALLLASQLVWAIILWSLAGWLWKVHRQRLVIHGG
ncbi:MAG TPA: ABC-2 family transporter protein [Chloroflexota bacterium]|nr:ABC-2 family transporter protein [Chloroflexota bacterium]